MMAPVNLLSYDFLACLASTQNPNLKKSHKEKPLSDDVIMIADSESEDDHEIKKKISVRRTWNNKKAAVAESSKKLANTDKLNKALRSLRREKFKFRM